MVANFGELLMDNRLDLLVVAPLLGVNNFRLNSEFPVLHIERKRGILDQSGAAEEHIVAHLSCGTDSDFDAIVGGFQIVAGLRCKRRTENYYQSCRQQDARSHAASSPRKKKFKTRRTYVARS